MCSEFARQRIPGQLLDRNVQWFRGGLIGGAHNLMVDPQIDERFDILMSPLLSPVKVMSPPLSSEHGTHKTVKARFWLWLFAKSPRNILSCSLFARKRFSDPFARPAACRFVKRLSHDGLLYTALEPFVGSFVFRVCSKGFRVQGFGSRV